MAHSAASLRRTGPGQLQAISASRWLPVVVRGALVVYLGFAILIQLATVDTIHDLRGTPCESGNCFYGQLSQDSFDRLADVGISSTTFALVATVIPLLIPLVGHTLAAVTIWQRPTAWLPGTFVFSLALCTVNASGAFYILAMEHPSWERALTVLLIPSLVSLFLLMLVFPDGRFVPRWSVLLLVFPALDGAVTLEPEIMTRLPGWLDRLYLWWYDWGYLALSLVILWRLHVTRDRIAFRQTRLWFLGQVPLWTLLVVQNLWLRDESFFLSGRLSTFVLEMAYSFGIISVLGGFLLAIYLYNVYDLRLLASRSLVYGVLTVFLLAIYLLTVTAVAVTTSQVNNAVPALLATAIIAVAFAPLRDRLQRLSARLLYGDRVDPYGVLTRLGRQIGQNTAPQQLAESVVALAQDTLRVPGIALTVPDAPALDVRIGHLPPEATELPVSYREERLGTLAVAPRGPGETFSSGDRQLLDDIARQIGIAAHSILLAEDLRQSRELIVTAREEERRRIRRDLHDGLGPSLAALSLQVEIARDLIEVNPGRSASLLDDVLAQSRDAIFDIRRLVYDLRPPALDDLGLLEAIRTQASRYEHHGLSIAFDLPARLPPLSAAVEVAVFRIVQESLTNVVRHARASAAAVRIAHRDDRLEVAIEDDGRGIPDQAEAGIGLRSMHERAGELGGSCSVSSMPGGGTRVWATFRLDGNEERPDA